MFFFSVSRNILCADMFWLKHIIIAQVLRHFTIMTLIFVCFGAVRLDVYISIIFIGSFSLPLLFFMPLFLSLVALLRLLWQCLYIKKSFLCSAFGFGYCSINIFFLLTESLPLYGINLFIIFCYFALPHWLTSTWFSLRRFREQGVMFGCNLWNQLWNKTKRNAAVAA